MSDLYGVVAMFETPDGATRAAKKLRESGYRWIEAYTPFPVEDLESAFPAGNRILLPVIMVLGAAFGASYGYWVQLWDEALNYPINVGGRPYDFWPAFVVGTFEFMLLCSMAAGFFALLLLSRMPKLDHPIFHSRLFPRSTCDRFLLCVEAQDPTFETSEVLRLFDDLGAEAVEEVFA